MSKNSRHKKAGSTDETNDALVQIKSVAVSEYAQNMAPLELAHRKGMQP